MALETDSIITEEAMKRIRKIEEIDNVKFINPIMEGVI